MKFKPFFAYIILITLSLFSCNKQDKQVENQPPANTHNSQNSLDWSGTYSGTLPCASCEAIKMSLILNEDGTYEQTSVYLGENKSDAFIETGTFKWNKASNTITLEQKEKPNQFFVGENYLAKLDMDGNRITGTLADKYILTKEDSESN